MRSIVFTDIAHSVVCVSVCVLCTQMNCAKTARPFEMPSGGWITWVQGTIYQWGTRKGHGALLSLRDKNRPIVAYLRTSALRFIWPPPHTVANTFTVTMGVWHDNAASCPITWESCYLFYQCLSWTSSTTLYIDYRIFHR